MAKSTPSGIVAQTEAFNRSIIDWTPDMVVAAEAMADCGNLRLAAALCDRMMTDDRISRCLEALAGVASLPLTFQPPKGGDPETDEVSLALQEDWWKFFPECEQSRCIKRGRLLGVSVQHTEDWRRDPDTGRVLPITEVWHPGNLRFDWQARAWFIRLDNQEVRLDTQPERWWLHCPFGKRTPWSVAPWRGLARWWLLKQYAISDWARYSERHGLGTQVVTEEANEQADYVSEDDRKKVVESLKRLARDAVAFLPKGCDLNLMESTANTWSTFRAQIEMADAAFAIALTGQNLTSEVKGGSFAAAGVHDKVEGRVIHSEASALSTDEHDGVIVLYTEFNFGNARKAPYPKYNTERPADMAARADVLVKVSTFVANLVNAGFEPDIAEIQEQFGVALTKGERRQIEQVAKKAVARHMPMAKVERDPRIDDGQEYADRVSANMTDHGTRLLAPTVAAMMSAVTSAQSYAEALQAIKDKYAGLRTPAELVRLTEAALVMTELGGQLSAQEHIDNDEA